MLGGARLKGLGLALAAGSIPWMQNEACAPPLGSKRREGLKASEGRMAASLSWTVIEPRGGAQGEGKEEEKRARPSASKARKRK